MGAGRKVTVFKWEAVPSNDGTGGASIEKRETDVKGIFHQFGSDFEEFETGPGNYTTAIIELPDGTIITPLAELIRFDE